MSDIMYIPTFTQVAPALTFIPDLKNLSYPSLSPGIGIFSEKTQKIEIIMDRKSKGGVLVKETNQRNQQKPPSK